MARLIEMMKESAVPAGVMRSASRGALALPVAEMLEILVFLSEHPVFGEQARTTLAGFDEVGSATALGDPNTPEVVLKYFLAPANQRAQLLPVLFKNPSVPEDILAAAADSASGEVAGMLLSSPRVMGSAAILGHLLKNANLTTEQHAKVEQTLSKLGGSPRDKFASIGDGDVLVWLTEHEAELQAEQREEKPFTLLGGLDELGGEGSEEITAEALEIAKATGENDDERISTLQKLARMNIVERIKTAITGTKEERSILIRDGATLVCSAVLVSPKVSDQEIEGFANMKNVRENVLRDIGRNHRFKKNYVVVRNLCNNPRTPLDLSLSLLKNLLGPDLKTLSMNKNVPETLRKMADKLFKVRTNSGRGA
jgi:hypothetical protein